MKRDFLKIFIVIIGLITLGVEEMFGSSKNQFNKLVSSELSHFHLQGLYVILGIIASGILFYCVTNRLNIEKPMGYSQTKHQHRRTIIKKTP